MGLELRIIYVSLGGDQFAKLIKELKMLWMKQIWIITITYAFLRDEEDIYLGKGVLCNVYFQLFNLFGP